MPSISNDTKLEQPTPFQNLNQQLDSQNETLAGLISRLRNSLHNLSDTNVPVGEGVQSENKEQLPFKDGYLMSYYLKLKSYDSLIMQLQIQVEKLGSLI